MTNGKPTLCCWLCWIVGAIALISYCAPTSAAPETESASGLLDDLGGGLFTPKKPTTPNNESELGPQQLSPAGEDLGQSANDSPLAQIAGNMKQAKRLIAQQNLKGETAQVQDQVLADLDALIKQAQQQNQNQQQQQQQQQQQASQRNRPQAGQANQPAGQPQPGGASAARTSDDRLRQSREADAAAGLRPQELLKDVWGQLPERVRQQLLQSSTDEFLPEYRDAIELYFRRLADEESRGSSPSEP